MEFKARKDPSKGGKKTERLDKLRKKKKKRKSLDIHREAKIKAKEKKRQEEKKHNGIFRAKPNSKRKSKTEVEFNHWTFK